MSTNLAPNTFDIPAYSVPNMRGPPHMRKKKSSMTRDNAAHNSTHASNKSPLVTQSMRTTQ